MPEGRSRAASRAPRVAAKLSQSGSSWRPATQRDVARLAGVSQAAVSRWSSGRGYVASAVRQQIVHAAAVLDYKPHPLAQGLINGQSDMVAVVIADIANPGYQMMLEGLTQRLQANGLQVLLFVAGQDQSVDDVIPDVLRYRVRGAIITTSQLSSKAATRLVKRGVPVVLFHRYTTAGGSHCVVCDNQDGGRQAAAALLDAGARRLAFIGGRPDTSSNSDRRIGFVQEIERRGLPPPVALDGHFTYEWGTEATLSIFERDPRVDGLFCADDEIAMGAIDVLRYRLGKSVPTDVRVVGFDAHPAGARAAYDLTTIQQPFDEMIIEAVGLLLDGDPSKPTTRLLKGRLVARGTA